MENKLTTLLNGMDALICGSTSGIGLSCAREFALSGANVALFSRNKEKRELFKQKMTKILGDRIVISNSGKYYNTIKTKSTRL